MFKKALLVLGLSLAVTASAFAAVTEKKEEGHKYSLSYPVFKLENRAAAKAINKDIKKMVLEQKKLAKSKDPATCRLEPTMKFSAKLTIMLTLSL